MSGRVATPRPPSARHDVATWRSSRIAGAAPMLSKMERTEAIDGGSDGHGCARRSGSLLVCVTADPFSRDLVEVRPRAGRRRQVERRPASARPRARRRWAKQAAGSRWRASCGSDSDRPRPTNSTKALRGATRSRLRRGVGNRSPRAHLCLPRKIILSTTTTTTTTTGQEWEQNELMDTSVPDAPRRPFFSELSSLTAAERRALVPRRASLSGAMSNIIYIYIYIIHVRPQMLARACLRRSHAPTPTTRSSMVPTTV